MFRFSGWVRIALIVAGVFVSVDAAKAAEPFLPAPVADETFDAEMLHVDRFGEGKKAVVLIPGLASGAWVWYGTIGRFSGEYSLYVITLPGFDGRAAASEKSLFDGFARDFWKMLETHKIEKPVVIGHSLGGTLAIGLAEEHAERLGGIVAVDGLPVFPMAAFATQQQRAAMGKQMAEMYAAYSKEEVLAAEKEYMRSVGTNKPELVEATAKLEARSDPAAVGAWMREDLEHDLRPGLGKIAIPFLEIMPYEPADAKGGAGYTQEQTLEFYKSLVKGAPQVNVVAVVPARHFVMLDQPEEFYKVVAGFLAGK